MRTTKLGRRILAAGLLLALMGLTVFIVSLECGVRNMPVIARVKLETAGRSREDVRYCALYGDNISRRLRTPVEDTAFRMFSVDVMAFEHDFTDEGIENTFTGTTVMDEAGSEVPADEATLAAIRAVAGVTKHAIWRMRIFTDGASYFVSVILNVNWSDPCYFYQYDPADGTPEVLKRWDGWDVAALETV